jgi:hypothetical protein
MGVEMGWARVNGPETVSTILLWMQGHPIWSAFLAALLVLAGAAVASERHVRRAARLPEDPPIQRHEHVHKWDLHHENTGTPDSTDSAVSPERRFGFHGPLVVEIVGFGISQFRFAKGKDGLTRVVRPRDASPTDEVGFALALRLDLMNRSAIPASLRFALVDGTGKSVYSDAEHTVGLHGIPRLPSEVFFFAPVRLDAFTHLAGVLWFMLTSVKKEDDLPMERLDVTDEISGQTAMYTLTPELRKSAKRASGELRYVRPAWPMN